jgi:hypothetical protein
VVTRPPPIPFDPEKTAPRRNAVQSRRAAGATRAMKSMTALLVAAVLSAAYLSACNMPFGAGSPEAAPTDPAAAQTVQAVLTNAGPDIRATGLALQTPAGPPTASPPPAVSPSATPDGICQNRANFVDDVTIPDNTRLDPDEDFVKIWRLQNNGECTWTPAFLLAFIGGQRLEAPDLVPLSTHVAPGQMVDLAVDMQAPDSAGTYQGYWKLRSPEGAYFGIGPQGDQSFWVKIVVPAPPTELASATPAASATIPATATISTTATGTPTASASPTATPTGTESATPTATLTPTAES